MVVLSLTHFLVCFYLSFLSHLWDHTRVQRVVPSTKAIQESKAIVQLDRDDVHLASRKRPVRQTRGRACRRTQIRRIKIINSLAGVAISLVDGVSIWALNQMAGYALSSLSSLSLLSLYSIIGIDNLSMDSPHGHST